MRSASLATLLLGAAARLTALGEQDAAAYKSDIRPLLVAYCQECHKAEKKGPQKCAECHVKK